MNILVEITLVFPFNTSAQTFIDFCNVWDCKIISVGTNQEKAIFIIAREKFKKIFHKNPVLGEYEVPSGAEKFIENVHVTKILIE